MPRAKTGNITRRRHKRVLKQAKGYFGSKSTIYKTANEQVMKSLSYAYRDRKQRKRDFRKLWITRINAATRQHDMSYSQFTYGLKLSNINLDRKSLAELAISEPATFATLVDTAKKAIASGKTYPKQTPIMLRKPVQDADAKAAQKAERLAQAEEAARKAKEAKAKADAEKAKEKEAKAAEAAAKKADQATKEAEVAAAKATDDKAAKEAAAAQEKADKAAAKAAEKAEKEAAAAAEKAAKAAEKEAAAAAKAEEAAKAAAEKEAAAAEKAEKDELKSYKIEIPTTALSGMTVPELKALCKQAGIVGYSKLKKAELVEILLDYDNK